MSYFHFKDINETLEGSRRDMSTDTEDADVTLTEDMLTNRSSHESPPRRVPAAPGKILSTCLIYDCIC